MRRLVSGCAALVAAVAAVVLCTPGAARAACPLIVDASGSGTHTSIQAAVTAFQAQGNLGPCAIEVRAGVYAESVEIVAANTGATSDAQRLEIRADAGARILPGSHHAFLLRSSRFVTIRGFEITGATNEPFSLDGGRNANRDVTLDSNRVVSNGGGRDSGCITVNAGNSNVWVVNNVCRDNGAVGIHVGSGGPNHLVNNLVVRQQKTAVVVDAGASLVLANNLIVLNGTDSDGAQYGIALGVKQGTTSQVRLLHNLLYQNKSGDILNASSAVQNAGNLLTPALGTLTLSSFFVDFEGGDLHSAAGSPAIDAGASTTGTTPERVPLHDFEDDPRSAPVDIGPDEVSDGDHDGVPDTGDNCPAGMNAGFNPGQADRDGDGVGDSCDNCPKVANPGQEDADGSSRGDACEEIGETLQACPPGDLEACVLVASFGALENVQTIRPDCLNTYFFCTDASNREMPRSDLLPPPRGIPNDVASFAAGAEASVACDFASHFPVNAFAPGTYTCKACYANEIQDPDISATGECTSALGCSDLFQGITCSPPVSVVADPTVSAEACSPGYWKNNAEKAGASQWPPTGYAPGDGFDEAFGISLFGPSLTLLQALGLQGGGQEALARHAAAGLLSAAHPEVHYPLSVEAIKVLMQTGDREALLQRLSTLSGLTCPLPQGG